MTKVLYILARSDMNSLNPGKLAAQVSHAASCFHERMYISLVSDKVKDMFQEWKSETLQGFGTVIVKDCLSEKLSDIQFLLDMKSFKYAFISEVITDPTYPVRDGKVTHLISIPTCMYVFCDSESDVAAFLKEYPLYA